MIRYLNPKSDLVFKRIFGEHPDLLISFLNAILPLDPDRLITEIAYLPAEQVPEIPGFKYTVVDVRCRDTAGRYFIVEMQLNWSAHFIQRMIFNTAATYVKQLPKGADYEKLCPVYGLAIVDDVFSQESDWFHHYQLMNPKRIHQTLDDLQLVFLELPKFKPITKTEKKLSVLWMRYMTEINEQTEQVDPLLLEEPTIHKALNLTEIAAYSPEELRSYDANWDAIRSANTLFNDKYNQGLEEGLEKGEMERQYKVAKKSLLKGLDVQTVVEITELSFEEVEKISINLKSSET